MNQPTLHSQEPLHVEASPAKKGCGCLMFTLTGLAVLAMALVAAAWLVLMHTALPLRAVANAIEEMGWNSEVKISGLSGSLASGVSFQKVEWDKGEITDMRIRYSGLMAVIFSKELVIQEMHVGSAAIDSDFFVDEPKSQDEPATANSGATSATIDLPLRLLQIDHLSLNQIILRDPITAEPTVSIPKIEWTGLRFEQGKFPELGNLDIEADSISIKTDQPSDSVYSKHIEILLKPEWHARILKPIRIDALVGEKDEKPIFDIKAFDESVILARDVNGQFRLQASGVNLAEFIDAPLPNRLHFEMAGNEIEEPEIRILAGSFQLGSKTFEIQSVATEGAKDASRMAAICRDSDTEIRYAMSDDESSPHPRPQTPVLSSTPTMEPEELMARIFHDQPFSSLSSSDQEKLREDMAWFSFSK